jgi:hypothetical protein
MCYNPEDHGFDSRRRHWFLFLIRLFSRTVALGSTQTLIEISTRTKKKVIFLEGRARPVRRADRAYFTYCSRYWPSSIQCWKERPELWKKKWWILHRLTAASAWRILHRLTTASAWRIQQPIGALRCSNTLMSPPLGSSPCLPRPFSVCRWGEPENGKTPEQGFSWAPAALTEQCSAVYR